MIPLLYCGNRAVFPGLLISALSVAMHTSQPLCVHLLTMDGRATNPRYVPIAAEQADFLEQTLQAYHSQTQVTLHDATALFEEHLSASPNCASSYTPYTLLRLLADLLPLPGRVLYLDTDTVAKGDLATLMNFDLNGCDYAGVIDYLGRVFIAPHYINAGVLLLDLKQIREDGFFIRCRALCNQKKYAFPDQDVIHHLSKRKCFLPRKYNEQRKMRPDTVIRHFSKSIRWWPFYHTVNIKPWNIEQLHQVYHTFDFDDVLDVYRKARTEHPELFAQILQ